MDRPPFAFTDLIRHLDAAKADVVDLVEAGNTELAALRARDVTFLRHQIESLRIFDDATPMFAGRV